MQSTMSQVCGLELCGCECTAEAPKLVAAAEHQCQAEFAMCWHCQHCGTLDAQDCPPSADLVGYADSVYSKEIQVDLVIGKHFCFFAGGSEPALVHPNKHGRAKWCAHRLVPPNVLFMYFMLQATSEYGPLARSTTHT